MALHLNTSNINGSKEATNANSGLTGVGRTGVNFSVGRGAGASDSGSPDSVSFSGASRALATSFSERSGRIQQLTQAVQNGTYQVSSAAISQSIVSSAIS